MSLIAEATRRKMKSGSSSGEKPGTSSRERNHQLRARIGFLRALRTRVESYRTCSISLVSHSRAEASPALSVRIQRRPTDQFIRSQQTKPRPSSALYLERNETAATRFRASSTRRSPCHAAANMGLYLRSTRRVPLRSGPLFVVYRVLEQHVQIIAGIRADTPDTGVRDGQDSMVAQKQTTPARDRVSFKKRVAARWRDSAKDWIGVGLH